MSDTEMQTRPMHYIGTGAGLLALGVYLGSMSSDDIMGVVQWALTLAGATFWLIGCIALGVRLADKDRERIP
jgi:hypothetical protein